jgi:CubicO group peptidase (beta-lactamase class C family)
VEGFVHPDFTAVADRLDAIMSGRRSRGGAAVAVYHHGEPVVDIWTGTARAGLPWQRDTMAVSFSTTKGVVATVVHRLVDRGLLSYDEPVATWWPEFAANGKADITLRHLLTHQAGMHRVRNLVDRAETLLDWDEMTTRLAAAEPAWPPGTAPGYHALTYGWLVGEVIRRVTGGTVAEAVRNEICVPLGIDGLTIGARPEMYEGIAPLHVDPAASARLLKLFHWLETKDRYRPMVEALVVDDYLPLAATDRILTGEIPAANGAFTARSLARMYAALATPDAFDGPPLLSPATLAEATRVQTSAKDRVVLFRMQWRLGYHLAATTAGVLPRGFGHFGFGGSGAWGDPESGLAVAMVLTRVAGTPFADTRFLRVGAAAVRSARARILAGAAPAPHPSPAS